MNREPAALLARPARFPTSRQVAPVLIQVPTLSGRERARSSRLQQMPGRRRRLRKEVRMVGSGLFIGAAMASVILLLCGIGPGVLTRPMAQVADRPGTTWREGSGDTKPVSIRLESPVPLNDPVVPVAFGGYLLPVDSQEEVRHAGG